MGTGLLKYSTTLHALGSDGHENLDRRLNLIKGTSLRESRLSTKKNLLVEGYQFIRLSPS